MKKSIVGICAHVDAGKTTMCEALLYLTGAIRHHGRVDHQDAFLDYNVQERERGITIFSKQAHIVYKDLDMLLLDTPGHVDFSAEMERSLQVLDYAIVVVSGLDGIQNHTRTIFELLEYYHVPTFVFVNKMDMDHSSYDCIQSSLYDLDERFIDMTHLDESYEDIALVNEQLLDEYLKTNCISSEAIASLVLKRQLFPCYYGSALKMQGVQEFLDALALYILPQQYREELALQVYKVSLDEQGQRLTHVKVLGGRLKVKQFIGDEKIDQIRLYNGHKYELTSLLDSGEIGALTGITHLKAGDCIGVKQPTAMLSSYMTYHILLPDDCDQQAMIQNLLHLSDEIPELHIQYNSDTKQLTTQLMGEIQLDVLKRIVMDRYHVGITFDQGQVLFKETIDDVVEGVGHFEPLRHYAEVHVLLQPLKRGSGLVFESLVKDDVLDQHWQRLILTHMQECEHLGVLTGSPITDIKISLVNGKAHLKHTEGGDFREATYRAIRHGLKKAQSVLLEPYYEYTLELSHDYMSKAMFDLEKMHASIEVNHLEDGCVLTGFVPVRFMKDYQQEVIRYTKGQGKLYCKVLGYREAIGVEDVIVTIQYDSEKDVLHPTGSVFCRHGAGFYVPYNEVEDYMHLPAYFKKRVEVIPEKSYFKGTDEELENIFERTYGPMKTRLATPMHKVSDVEVSNSVKPLPECLLVDGYNVIHAWPMLKELARENLDAARTRLIDILGNYQGYKQCTLIIVFDAYKVKGHVGTYEQIHNVHIVYTKEAQTADMYIERTTHRLSKDYRVVVATSDALEQSIVIGAGARRMSSRELLLDVEALTSMKKEEFDRKQKKSRNYLLEDIKKYHQ